MYLQPELVANVKHQHHIYIHIKIQPITQKDNFISQELSFTLWYTSKFPTSNNTCIATQVLTKLQQLFHQDFDPSPTSPSWLRNTTIVSWMLHLFSIESHGQRLSNGLYLHRPNKPWKIAHLPWLQNNSSYSCNANKYAVWHVLSPTGRLST
jgi:hypothetical protein